ncbi:MAG: toll/interleukin-1 receptor domain-containing protein [Candidatus Woesearchaeota archaeon]|jgi:hypothetical protein
MKKKEQEFSINESEKENFIPKTLRLFISYSTEEKLIAGSAKEAFNHFSFDVFLAHEDIPPGEKWSPYIIKNLKQRDIFIALLSKNFISSQWTAQEAGVAIGDSKFIIPISIDGTLPYGFMADYQAFKKFHFKTYTLSNSTTHIDCHDAVFEVVKFLGEKQEFRQNIKDSMIVSLSSARSFRDAEAHMSYLLTFKPFSDTEAFEIFRRAISNRQVSEASGCIEILKEMFKEYKNKLPEKLLSDVKTEIPVIFESES